MKTRIVQKVVQGRSHHGHGLLREGDLFVRQDVLARPDCACRCGLLAVLSRDVALDSHSFESIARLVDERTFNVTANGRTALKAWSPGKVAGGPLKAAEASFKVTVRDGRLRLQFEPVGGAALIAAITIAP